mgnify:FL=1
MSRAVPFINAPALGTGTAGIPRIHENQRGACFSSLVGDVEAKLGKGPRVVLSPLAPTDVYPGPDPAQVFQGDTPSSVESLAHHFPADIVVHPPGEPSLLSFPFSQEPLGRGRALALQPGPESSVPLSEPIEVSPGVDLPIAIGQDVDDAQVTAQKATRFIGSWLWADDDLIDIEAPIAVDQVGLVFSSGENIPTMPDGVTVATDEDCAIPLVGVAIEGHGPQGAKDSHPVAVGFDLVGVSHLSDSYRGLNAGQSEAGPQLMVGAPLKGQPGEDPLGEGYLGEPVASRVETGYDLYEGIWGTLKLQFKGLHCPFIVAGRS